MSATDRKYKNRVKLLAGTAIVALALTPMSAYAQIDEIITTAQKRAESTQDVPIVVAKLDTEQLEKRGIDDVLDLRGIVPGFEIRRSLALGNPTFTIRGVGSTNFDSISGATVATYIDDAPVVSVGQLNFTTFDLESIEVLKGPQGTLFGSGTTAGLVNIRSAKPTREKEGYGKIGAGNFGSFLGEGVVSGPLSDTLSGRLSVRGETTDGFYFNTANNEETGGQDAFQIRGQLLHETDKATVHFGARYSHSSGQSALYDVIPLLEDDGTGVGRFCAPIQAGIDRGGVTQADVEQARTQCVNIYNEPAFAGDDPFTGFNQNLFEDNDENSVDLETYGFNLRADINAGDNIITSISSLDVTEHGGNDPEGPGRAGATDVFWITDVFAISQEFRLSSGPGSSTPWVIGVNGQYNEIENDLQSLLTFSSFPNAGVAFTNETFLETIAASGLYLAPQKQDSVELGAFAQADWRLNDQLTLVTGGRISWYDRENTVNATITPNSPTAPAGTFVPNDAATFNSFFDGVVGPVTTDLSETGFSFNVGLNYQISDDALLYGKVSQGIKSGSHAGGFIFNSVSALGAEQETLLSYEAGLKAQNADRTLQFNAAAFFYDYKDVQSLTQELINNVFVQTYANIGDAEVLGAEADLTWAPNDRFFVNVGAIILDAEVKDTRPTIFASFDGNDLSTAPDFSASWTVGYTLDGPAGSDIDLQYNGGHVGDQFRNVENDPLSFDEATTTHNASVTLVSADDAWELQAFVRNFTDEIDLTWEFNFGGGSRRGYLAPRTWGGSIKRRF